MSCPTLTGFISWASTAMGVTSTILPSTSPYWGYAFNVAKEIVNPQLGQASSLIYELAVYNLAGDNLINYAQDPDGAPLYANGMTFFKYMRNQFECHDFLAGVVTESTDEGTSANIEVTESLKNLTIGQLQNLKTPFGRQYLAFAASVGNIWGIT